MEPPRLTFDDPDLQARADEIERKSAFSDMTGQLKGAVEWELIFKDLAAQHAERRKLETAWTYGNRVVPVKRA